MLYTAIGGFVGLLLLVILGFAIIFSLAIFVVTFRNKGKRYGIYARPGAYPLPPLKQLVERRKAERRNVTRTVAL